jgi:hypothetical protein
VIVLGGHGVSASYDDAPAVTFANNDTWHDDVAPLLIQNGLHSKYHCRSKRSVPSGECLWPCLWSSASCCITACGRTRLMRRINPQL